MTSTNPSPIELHQMSMQSHPRAPGRKNQQDHFSISLEGVRWLYIDRELCSTDFSSRKDISGQVIKRSAKRRVICSEDDIFVKDIHYDGARSVVKTIFGGTACKEGKINLELARRGVNVPKVIAYGMVKSGGLLRRDLLLTKKVDDALPLHDFILNSYKSQAFSSKCAFIEDFARFIRSLHEGGIRHSDLHVGNILVRAQGERPFFLLDVDRVTIHDHRLNKPETVDNLALLLCTFWPLSSSLERFHFMKFYGGFNHLSVQADIIKAIKAAALKISHRVWRAKSIRCLASNSRFIKSRFADFTIYRVQKPKVENALSVLLPDPDKILEQGVLMKNGRTVKAAKVEINGQAYFLKRYNCKGDLYRFRNALRRSRAVRTWLASWGMTVRSIPVPEALICLEERRIRLLERSYILFEYVEASRLCDIWTSLDEFGKRRILSQLAILLGKLHQSGCYHGDLKWPNILVREVEGSQQIVLSDLDGSRVNIRPGAARARRDVKRFLKDLQKTGEASSFEAPFLKIWHKWSEL